MPYRDEEIRTRKYELAIIPDNIAAKFTALKPLMQDLQEARQAEIVTIEVCCREKLDDAGVMGSFRIPYLNFVRAIYRGSGSNSGIALQKVVTAEKAKFVSYGLDSSLLDLVASCVVGVTPY
jgi:hypothetical protein